MNKNKIIFGVILGIFLVGLVSASITGYLISGNAITEKSGYTATLQRVEGSTAIVSVKTPEGNIGFVEVEEGRTAQVGDAQISVSDLKKGTLFTRGGANVEIYVVPAGEVETIGVEGSEEGLGDTKGHTHLVDYQYVTNKLNLNSQTATYNEFAGKIDCVKFGKDYVILGGGYAISPKVPAGYIIETNGPVSNQEYLVELRDYNVQYQTLTGNVFATCARLEKAIGSKEPHF